MLQYLMWLWNALLISMSMVDYHIALVGSIVMDLLHRRQNRLKNLPDLTGKVAVVTGGSRGIGLEVVKCLSKLGAHVVVGARDAAASQEGLRKKVSNADSFTVYELDLASLQSTRLFAEHVMIQYSRIDILVNNAGVFCGPRKLTVDGNETQLATNYLGHFYLTHLLIPALASTIQPGSSSSDPLTFSRIVNVSSCAHYGYNIDFDDINMQKMYTPLAAYSRSKLAQLMFSRHLDALLRTHGLPIVCLAAHPGVVATDMARGTAPILLRLLKSPEQGSRPILYAALASAAVNNGDTYISNCGRGWSSFFSKNAKHQKRLFQMTCKMLKIQEFLNISN